MPRKSKRCIDRIHQPPHDPPSRCLRMVSLPSSSARAKSKSPAYSTLSTFLATPMQFETLLKAEQDYVEKLKDQKKKLSEDLKIKRLQCSEKELTKIELLNKKSIWEDLLHEAQNDLNLQETLMDELQQSVCADRLALYNNIKEFLTKQKSTYPLSVLKKKTSMPLLTDTVIKIEPEEIDECNLIEEMLTLENQLEELKAEKIKIEEAKRLKAHLEAEPSCGEAFIRVQKLLKDVKHNLKIAEDETTSLKKEIAEKKLLLLSRNFSATEIAADSRQNCGQKLLVHGNPIKNPAAESSSKPYHSKTVSFNSTVEMKTISPPLKSKIHMKRNAETKSPSLALRKKLAQQITSELDESMRNIIFKENMLK